MTNFALFKVSWIQKWKYVNWIKGFANWPARVTTKSFQSKCCYVCGWNSFSFVNDDASIQDHMKWTPNSKSSLRKFTLKNVPFKWVKSLGSTKRNRWTKLKAQRIEIVDENKPLESAWTWTRSLHYHRIWAHQRVGAEWESSMSKVNFIPKHITIKLSQKCCSKLITLPSNEPIILNIYYKYRIWDCLPALN